MLRDDEVSRVTIVCIERERDDQLIVGCSNNVWACVSRGCHGQGVFDAVC